MLLDITQDPDDPDPWDSMAFQIRDAFRNAEESYRYRSRDYAVAADVLKLHLHPLWLQHCFNDVPLPRQEFIERYGAAFPGAAFTRLHRVQTGMSWTAPG